MLQWNLFESSSLPYTKETTWNEQISNDLSFEIEQWLLPTLKQSIEKQVKVGPSPGSVKTCMFHVHTFVCLGRYASDKIIIVEQMIASIQVKILNKYMFWERKTENRTLYPAFFSLLFLMKSRWDVITKWKSKIKRNENGGRKKNVRKINRILWEPILFS